MPISSHSPLLSKSPVLSCHCVLLLVSSGLYRSVCSGLFRCQVCAEWNHTLCGILWLGSFTQHNPSKVDPCVACLSIGLAKKFLWIFVTSYRKPKQTFWSTQYFMPFYCQIIPHCLIAILSIHSLAKGLLSCFYFFRVWMKLLWTSVYKFLCGHLFTRTGIAQSYSDSPLSQGGGVEGHVLIFSCENSKITTHCWTTIDRRMLDPTKKRYPTSKGTGEAPTRW